MINVVAVMLAVALCIGCETTQPVEPVPVDSTVAVHENVRADSSIGWIYYSVESGTIIPAQAANGSAWDVRMPYIQCCGRTKAIAVQLNSGGNGSGAVQGAVITGRFDNVGIVPSGTVFRLDAADNPVVPLPVLGANVFFLYDIASHTLRPSPDKVLLIKTSSGKVFKMQITSIYKDAIPNPTEESPIGFYHFRSAQIAQ
ncbi:MAG: HmuY family protein [Ignavibacteria bacterium]|jgi:hypothetical protein